ncbi:MAG: hypothetical protein ACJATP_003615 [Candidatus Azotimanducaceae bacterium]|jgi:hypothetical protein
MSNAISQMQMVYNAEEDRVLFRLNSTEAQEFRFWITQRYARLLHRVLITHVESDPDVALHPSIEGRQSIKQFKQAQADSSANFEQAFEEAAWEYPLGEAIMLAFQLTYKIQGENLHLSIQPKVGQGVNLVVNRDINAILCALLKSAAEKGGWPLDEAVLRPPASTRIIN